MVYAPKPFIQAVEPDNISRYVQDELQALSRDLRETTALELRTVHSEPSKPRAGMIVHADGTDWDPGAGRGTYVYDGGWVPVGILDANNNGLITGPHLTVGWPTINLAAEIFYGGTFPMAGSGDNVGLQVSPTFVGAASTTYSTVYGIACAPYLSDAGTFTTAYSIIAETWFKDAGVTVTNAYSLYVQPQNVGSTLNRSIYVEGGISEFDGQLIAKGTSTNDSAATGDIGEFVEGEVVFGSAVTLTNAVSADVTSISLTAGDWDVWGTVLFDTTNATNTAGWINTASATFPTAPNKGAYAASMTGVMDGPLGTRRISISSTTTVYLGAFASFPSGTTKAYGYIGARRVR